jgi:hypothetical protein
MRKVWFEKDHVRGVLRVELPPGSDMITPELVEHWVDACRQVGLVLVAIEGHEALPHRHDDTGFVVSRHAELSVIGGGRTLAGGVRALGRLAQILRDR